MSLSVQRSFTLQMSENDAMNLLSFLMANWDDNTSEFLQDLMHDLKQELHQD